MKKGIRGHDVNAENLETICIKCKESGFDYLQLVLEKSIDGFKYGDYSESYAKEISGKFNGMKIAVLGSYINPSNPDENALRADIDKFKEKIKYASVLNPIAVGTETGRYSNSDEINQSEDAYLHLLKTMKELTAEAEKYGVNIAIEGVHCFVINSPQKMKRIIDDLNSDNVKVIFDPLNYLNINNYKNQNEIINTAFDLFGDKIIAIHIKDFVIENGCMKSVIPGEGMLNYKLIFERMNKNIPLIAEEYSPENAEKGFENLSRFI